MLRWAKIKANDFRLYLRQLSRVAIVFLIGLVFAGIGGFFWQTHPRWSSTLIGIGSSLVAASVVAYLSPSNQELYQTVLKLGITEVHLSRSHVQYEQWVQWLRSARHQCVLFGIANNNWCNDPEFRPALSELARRDVTVKMFFLDPTSDVARQRAREEHHGSARDTIQTIRESIRYMWDLKQQLEPDAREHVQLFVYNATPSFGATWIDTLMVATHYLAGMPNVTSPCVAIKPAQRSGESRDLYGIYAENIVTVEKHYAIEIDENNIQTYTANHPAPEQL